MSNFVLSPQALDDLDAIWLYIAKDRLDAADRVTAAAYGVCRRLAQHPELGPIRLLDQFHPEPNRQTFRQVRQPIDVAKPRWGCPVYSKPRPLNPAFVFQRRGGCRSNDFPEAVPPPRR